LHPIGLFLGRYIRVLARQPARFLALEQSRQLRNLSLARRGNQIHHADDRFGHVVPGRCPTVTRFRLGFGPSQQIGEGPGFGVPRRRRHQQDADSQKAGTKSARHLERSPRELSFFSTALAARAPDLNGSIRNEKPCLKRRVRRSYDRNLGFQHWQKLLTASTQKTSQSINVKDR
jgi:hypothetical protein